MAVHPVEGREDFTAALDEGVSPIVASTPLLPAALVAAVMAHHARTTDQEDTCPN